MEQLIPVIIPSYEPDEKLLKLLHNLKEAEFKEVVIVDDGSEGETYQKIFRQAEQEFGYPVIHHEVNRGKGRALKTAFSYCLTHYAGRLLGCITIDSDGQHTVKDMKACMEALRSHPDSLILGVRDFNREDVPKRSSFGNKMTSKTMKLLVGLDISDTQTGLRGIPGDFMEELLAEKGERFEFETNMLLRTKNTGRSITEVPIETIYIEDNATSHFHPVRDSIRIYAIFLKFILVSLSSSIVDIVLFTVFLFVLKHFRGGAGSQIMIATVLARVLSSLYNFILNYKVVFQSSSSAGKTMVKYFCLAVCIMFGSGFLVGQLHRVLPWPETLIKIPVDLLLFFVSYYVQREYVYR